MRYDTIQLVRLAAALGVALYHLGHYAVVAFGANYYTLAALRWPPLARLPVPLFFAVSGFVLARALGAARGEPPARRAGRFLLARVVRLYPGYWLAAVAAFALYWALPPPGVAEALRAWHPAALTLLPLGPDATSYPLGVEWTLVYEAFLSAALALLSLVGPGRGLTVAAAAWLALLVAKSLAAPGLGTASLPTASVALSAYCAPFLGGVLAHAARDWRGRHLPWAAAALALGSWGWLSTAACTPEQFWLGAALPASLLVWLAARLPQVAPANRLARLGDRTYGLYLVHVPLMLVGFELLSRGGVPRGNLPGVAAVGAAAVALGLQFGRLEHALYRRLRRTVAR